MFTGIIEGVGRIATLEPRGGDVRLRVEVGTLPFDAVQVVPQLGGFMAQTSKKS